MRKLQMMQSKLIRMEEGTREKPKLVDLFTNHKSQYCKQTTHAQENLNARSRVLNVLCI